MRACLAILLTLLAPRLAGATASVTVTATAGAADLELDGEGAATPHIVKVAQLSVEDVGPSGFTLTVGSGALAKAGGAPIPFQVALVSDGAAPPAASAFTSALTFSTASSGAAVRDLYIRYDPAPQQDPGDYAAVIGVVIVDN